MQLGGVFAKHRPIDPALLHQALSLAEGAGSAEQRLTAVCAALRQALTGLDADTPAWLTGGAHLQTLQLLAQGLSNRRIARRLDIPEDTVKSQVRSMLDKLGMPNRTALALWAVRMGLVPLSA